MHLHLVEEQRRESGFKEDTTVLSSFGLLPWILGKPEFLQAPITECMNQMPA